LVADPNVYVCGIVTHSLDEAPNPLTLEEDMLDSILVEEVCVAEGTWLRWPVPTAFVERRWCDESDHHLAVAEAPTELAVCGRKWGGM
jgi:hypothetical protein